MKGAEGLSMAVKEAGVSGVVAAERTVDTKLGRVAGFDKVCSRFSL